MGKSKKRKNHKQPVPEQHQDPTTNPFQPAAKKAKFQAPSKHSPVPRNNKSSSSNIPVLLPPQFPPDQTFPQSDFLRNVHPYRESFQKAIETAYEGFAVDEETSKQGYCNKSSLFDHAKIQQSLKIMDDCGLFRTDVTQPFGLGTKCAKTYVTRCLLGEEGTTYKYLGLRMFAHPWCSTTTSRGGIPIKKSNNTNNSSDDNYNLEDALGTISKLNERLSERTKSHLNILQDKRRKRLGFNGGQPYIHGRASYDIALINRMTSSPDLKIEPTIGRDKTAVSWHADSSLEHYSSIAVYQTIISDTSMDTATTSDNSTASIMDNTKKFQHENDLASNWSIALRVAHNSEGPLASRRGTKIDSAVVTDTPAIAVSLQSRSAYYLLDDFNHHHQHAVLLSDNNNSRRALQTTQSAGVRYASTHRLLRESHNVNFMLERCRSTCSQFHKRGAKIWRSEQLLLSEIESDWIRQFYIQGQGHKDNLWKYWEKPMCQLLKYWEQLENRTKQVVDLLRFASMARCGMHEKKDGGKVPSRAERKMREKQKKALVVMEELVKRNDNGSCSVKTTFYDSIGILLEERANMRSLWLDRENDGVFHSMPVDYRPLPVPLQFGVTNSSSKIEAIGQSPLLGTADDLLRLRDGLIKCGSAYISQKHLDLPEMKDLDPVLKEKESEDAVFSQKRETKNDEQKEQPSTAEEIEVDKLAKEEEIKQKETVSIRRPITTAADHQKDFKWKGWSSIKVGLEMQEPWAALLLNGTKTIETRVYDIPKALLGKKIDILESKQGKDKLSSLSDVMVGEECSNAVKRIGWCIFDRVIIYRYKAKFESDESKHLVSPTSNYGWKDDTKIVYGWVVTKSGKYSNGKKKPLKRMNCAIRRMRSLFEIQS